MMKYPVKFTKEEFKNLKNILINLRNTEDLDKVLISLLETGNYGTRYIRYLNMSELINLKIHDTTKYHLSCYDYIINLGYNSNFIEWVKNNCDDIKKHVIVVRKEQKIDAIYCFINDECSGLAAYWTGKSKTAAGKYQLFR